MEPSDLSRLIVLFFFLVLFCLGTFFQFKKKKIVDKFSLFYEDISQWIYLVIPVVFITFISFSSWSMDCVVVLHGLARSKSSMSRIEKELSLDKKYKVVFTNIEKTKFFNNFLYFICFCNFTTQGTCNGPWKCN